MREDGTGRVLMRRLGVPSTGGTMPMRMLRPLHEYVQAFQGLHGCVLRFDIEPQAGAGSEGVAQEAVVVARAGGRITANVHRVEEGVALSHATQLRRQVLGSTAPEDWAACRTGAGFHGRLPDMSAGRPPAWTGRCPVFGKGVGAGQRGVSGIGAREGEGGTSGEASAELTPVSRGADGTVSVTVPQHAR